MHKYIVRAAAAIGTMATPFVALAANTTNPGQPLPVVHPNGAGDIQSIANTVIGFLLVLAGALAVIFLIIGGIRYLISSGDSAQIEKAKHTIQYAIIGLIVIIFAYVIVRSIIGGTS